MTLVTRDFAGTAGNRDFAGTGNSQPAHPQVDGSAPGSARPAPSNRSTYLAIKGELATCSISKIADREQP